MTSFSVNNLSEFEQATIQILTMIRERFNTPDRACVVCLTGDLGAGKTTMTQIIARQLGVVESVQSPTFVIKKTYVTHTPDIEKLVHMDVYRLEGNASLEPLQIHQDFISPKTMMIIEWPEIIAESIPDDVFRITIEHTQTGRMITLQ
jgi:tRNA threonylcarbamoyladenosine biosynthesis protein TsaE